MSLPNTSAPLPGVPGVPVLEGLTLGTMRETKEITNM